MFDNKFRKDAVREIRREEQVPPGMKEI